MRTIATIAAIMALATAQVGVAAQPAPSTTGQQDAPSPDSNRRRSFAANPELIVVSLTALAAFLAGLSAAVGHHGRGRPASP